jgi:CheY-like chemotaxis protein
VRCGRAARRRAVWSRSPTPGSASRRRTASASSSPSSRAAAGWPGGGDRAGPHPHPQRIVELFGGRLWLESEVGVGQHLRVRRAAVDSPPARRSPLEPSGSSALVVLLVDDDRASLDLMTAYLESAGLHLVRATDGSRRVRLAGRLRPEAHGPRHPSAPARRMAGPRAPAAGPAHRGHPGVVVSVLDERARGLALGAAAYLLKPVSRDDLTAALERVGVASGRSHGAGMRGPRILVVEDNPLNLKLVRDVLRESPATTSWPRPRARRDSGWRHQARRTWC